MSNITPMLTATSALGLDRRHPKVLLMVLPTPSPYHELMKTKHDVRLRCLPLTFTGKKQADENNHNNTQQPFYNPLSGTTRVSWYQKKHSPTHHPNHHPIFISFFHLPRSIASPLFKLHAWQSFCTTSSMSSLVYFLVWSPPLHIPYISSPNQCLLFAAHAHTIATCFAVVSILYHLLYHIRWK